MSDLDDTVARPRTLTPVRLSVPPGETIQIEIDLDSPDAVAEFLEHVAAVIRDRRRIVLRVG